MSKPRPAVVAGTVVAAHALDFLTFWMALALYAVPIEQERNGLAVAAYQAGGYALIAAYKLLLVAIMLGILSRVTEKPFWPPYLFIYILGIVGTCANLLSIHRIW